MSIFSDVVFKAAKKLVRSFTSDEKRAERLEKVRDFLQTRAEKEAEIKTAVYDFAARQLYRDATATARAPKKRSRSMNITTPQAALAAYGNGTWRQLEIGARIQMGFAAQMKQRANLKDSDKASDVLTEKDVVEIFQTAVALTDQSPANEELKAA